MAVRYVATRVELCCSKICSECVRFLEVGYGIAAFSNVSEAHKGNGNYHKQNIEADFGVCLLYLYVFTCNFVMLN